MFRDEETNGQVIYQKSHGVLWIGACCLNHKRHPGSGKLVIRCLNREGNVALEDSAQKQASERSP